MSDIGDSSESDFTDFQWHDAEILDISIPRDNPGMKDEVRIKVRSVEDEDFIFVFHECRKLDLEMNFGIVALETVRTAEVFEECTELDRIRIERKMIASSFEGLRCFTINTNSTNSWIRIYAKRCVRTRC